MIKENLFAIVFDFMKVTLKCYENTIFVNDKPAYASDIVLCAKWLAKIEDDVSLKIIIDDVLDTPTTKHILDRYKQGKFGDEQAKAFVNMKKKIEELGN